MKPRRASAGMAAEQRSRRVDDDESEDFEGLDEFEEDDEFDDEEAGDDELDEDAEDEELEEGYDDLDEDFDDDGEPRRGGGRPRKDWGE